MFSIRSKFTAATLIVAALSFAGCDRKDEAKTAPAPAAPPKPAAVAPAAAPPAAAPAPAPAPAAVTPPPAAVPQAAAPAPAQPPAPPPQKALASQEYSQDPELRGDVLEVKRVSGGALLIKWRLSKPASSGGAGLAAGSEKKIYHSFSWADVYVMDPAENKKYSGLKDTGGSWIGQGGSKNYGAGEQQVMWMKFPAPPAASAKVTFVFPGFAPFEDLPVAQ